MADHASQAIGPKHNADTGSEISSLGDYVELTVLDPGIFEMGKSYAASTLAHEAFHMILDLAGQNDKYSHAQEEIMAYDIGLGVLQAMEGEYRAQGNAEELARIPALRAKYWPSRRRGSLLNKRLFPGPNLIPIGR